MFAKIFSVIGSRVSGKEEKTEKNKAESRCRYTPEWKIGSYDAEFIFNAACGINGLVRVLNKNTNFSEITNPFGGNAPLDPVDENYLRCALTALSTKLTEYVEERDVLKPLIE